MISKLHSPTLKPKRKKPGIPAGHGTGQTVAIQKATMAVRKRVIACREALIQTKITVAPTHSERTNQLPTHHFRMTADKSSQAMNERTSGVIVSEGILLITQLHTAALGQ